LVVHDLDYMLRNLTSKKRNHMCMRSPCGLGGAILSFSEDGDVYACEEYEEGTKGIFHLGRLEDLDLGNLAAMSRPLQILWERRVERIPRCSRCTLRNFCGGGCTHKALAWWGDLLREDPMCRFFELTFTELMWKIWDEPDLVPALGG
jgi:radical SAM protein with 4Fe4S-binding SPASM domain